MTGPEADPIDDLGGECPRCGEAIAEAHVRASQIVLVPCGHAIEAMSSLDVPPEEL